MKKIGAGIHVHGVYDTLSSLSIPVHVFCTTVHPCYSQWSHSDPWNEDLCLVRTLSMVLITQRHVVPLKWGHLLIVRTANVVPQMSAIERFPSCLFLEHDTLHVSCYSLSLPLTLTHTHTHTPAHTRLTHTHTSHTHTHTHTHTHSLSATVSIRPHMDVNDPIPVFHRVQLLLTTISTFRFRFLFTVAPYHVQCRSQLS